MTVLRSPISAHTTVVPVDAPLSNPSYPIFYDLDAETIKVTDGADTTEWQVERGVANTQQAKHAKSVRLVANASPYGGSGGGVNVDNGTDPPAAVTTLVAPGADVSVPGQATVATVWQRNVGQAEFNYNGIGEVGEPVTPIPLTFNDGDEGLVDLTSPAAPLINDPGVYAFTLTITTNALPDGSFARLRIDDNYYSIDAYCVPERLGGAGRMGASITWFCDAADPFSIYVRAEQDGVPVAVGLRLLIQRVS